MNTLYNILHKYQDNLYFMGRTIAILVIGPILIYKGIIYKDILLILIGLILIIWDGLSIIFFPAKYCIKN